MTQTAKKKVLIIGLVCIFFSMLLPIWQRSQSSKLLKEISYLENTVSSLCDNKASLEARIASQSTMEYLFTAASNVNLTLAKLQTSSNTVIASN